MNALVILGRSIARRIGLKRLYYRFAPPHDYEEKFRAAILSRLNAGDIVWDVGANRGLYTRIFCDKTGAGGRVLAFEPVAETFAELCRNTAEYPWVRNERVALGDFDGVAQMVINPSYSPGNHLQRGVKEAEAANAVDVTVVRGDTFSASSGITPNVVKIDVEGFEEEVVNGMDGLLSAPELRSVFIEIHMQALEERGRALAPMRIEKLLRSKGLRPKWVDASHICADRESA